MYVGVETAKDSLGVQTWGQKRLKNKACYFEEHKLDQNALL